MKSQFSFSDQFEIPVVLQNQTDEDMVVEVVTDSVNLDLTGTTGQRVSVPANDRIEVRFPGTTDSAGTAYVRVVGVSGDDADAAMVRLPVYTPATTEAFATYGVVDDDGAVLQPISSPEGVFSQYGGLEITTSSTALQALTDAVLYLVSYPFDCSEQISSRILAIAAQLMSAKGYKGTTLQEIADLVGIHKSTIFHYFNNKEELLLEVLKISVEEVTAKLNQIIKDEILSPEKRGAHK